MVVELNATIYLVTCMKRMENSSSVLYKGEDNMLCSVFTQFTVDFILAFCYCSNCLGLRINVSLGAELGDVDEFPFSPQNSVV